MSTRHIIASAIITAGSLFATGCITIEQELFLNADGSVTETNADIVMNGKTAVWNCSLAAFANEKKPIEMKAIF